jgi:hypothetical protein
MKKKTVMRLGNVFADFFYNTLLLFIKNVSYARKIFFTQGTPQARQYCGLEFCLLATKFLGNFRQGQETRGRGLCCCFFCSIFLESRSRRLIVPNDVDASA